MFYIADDTRSLTKKAGGEQMIRQPKTVIEEILTHFIGSYVIRDSTSDTREWSVGRIWLYLNSKLVQCFENLPKEISFGTIESVTERLSNISIIELIALAYVASKSAKNNRINSNAREKNYGFKCALLNIAILRFYWGGQLYYVKNATPWLNKKERPFLLVLPDESNSRNLSLIFSIEGSYHINEKSFMLTRGENPTSFIKLHIPRIQLHPEISKIVKAHELGKATPVNLPSQIQLLILR